MDKSAVERQRLEGLLDRADVPRQQRAVLEAVIDNLAWQRGKLDDAREELRDASLVCPYDNGGGQTGVRKNPLFDAYINLFRAYLAGLDKLSSYLPKDLADEVTGDAVNVLDQVRQMKAVSS